MSDTAAAVAAVIADVGAVAKSGHNREQDYEFRTYDDVVAEVRRACATHGVFLVPQPLPELTTEHEVTSRSGKAHGHRVVLWVQYVIWGPSGPLASMLGPVPGEAVDYSDKAYNKCLTAAHKYALVELFLVGGGDDKDALSPEIVRSDPLAGAHAKAGLLSSIEALTARDPAATEALRARWKADRIPAVDSDAFSAAHLETVSSWIAEAHEALDAQEESDGYTATDE